MIKGLKFASIPVRNQDVSLEFYTTKLGFKVITDSPFDGTQRWIELRIPGAETRLVLFTPKGHENRVGDFSTASFWSDDIDATHATLVAAGVEVLGPPKKMEWGASMMFKDPDGNTFHVGSR
jgi:predicted enzyme related to lactoylglutathione lyase